MKTYQKTRTQEEKGKKNLKKHTHARTHNHTRAHW